MNCVRVEVALPVRANGYPEMLGVPVSCAYGRERNGSVVILATEVVAARSVMKRASKRVLKVVVYTPFVTVPALPLIDPVMVEEKVLEPLKVLSLARRVEEAAVMVMLPVPSKETPLMVRAFCNAVAVEALPVSAPMIPPLAFSTPPMLSTPLMVVEAATESEPVEVALDVMTPPFRVSKVVVAFEGNG